VARWQKSENSARQAQQCLYLPASSPWLFHAVAQAPIRTASIRGKTGNYFKDEEKIFDLFLFCFPGARENFGEKLILCKWIGQLAGGLPDWASAPAGVLDHSANCAVSSAIPSLKERGWYPKSSRAWE
jgi:hypothetical protein